MKARRLNFINAKMLEEQARDNFTQASVYRRNTRHMNLGNVKVEKLTEANNLEAAAIRRQVASLSACLGAAGHPCLNRLIRQYFQKHFPIPPESAPAADYFAGCHNHCASCHNSTSCRCRCCLRPLQLPPLWLCHPRLIRVTILKSLLCKRFLVQQPGAFPHSDRSQ